MYYETVIDDNECLKKANKILKNSLSFICVSYKKLLQKYIESLFKNKGKEVPNIEWEFECSDIIKGQSLIGSYDNNKIYVLPKDDGSFKVSIEVKTIIELDETEPIIVDPIKETLPPPIEYQTNMLINNVEFKNENEDFIEILEKYIDNAKSSGATEMYINSGGEILYPYNVKEDVKGKLSNNLLSEDEFDNFVDKIINIYKGIEVNEDTDVVCFHFGGDHIE